MIMDLFLMSINIFMYTGLPEFAQRPLLGLCGLCALLLDFSSLFRVPTDFAIFFP